MTRHEKYVARLFLVIGVVIGFLLALSILNAVSVLGSAA